MAALNKLNGVLWSPQIRKSLRNDIINKTLAKGQKVPSGDEPAVRFGVRWVTAIRSVFSSTINPIYRHHL